MSYCKGILSALMTPYNKNGELDESILRSYASHNINTMKVDGLYVGGSTGEALLTSTKERMDVLEIVKNKEFDKALKVQHKMNDVIDVLLKVEIYVAL